MLQNFVGTALIVLQLPAAVLYSASQMPKVMALNAAAGVEICPMRTQRTNVGPASPQWSGGWFIGRTKPLGHRDSSCKKPMPMRFRSGSETLIQGARWRRACAVNEPSLHMNMHAPFGKIAAAVRRTAALGRLSCVHWPNGGSCSNDLNKKCIWHRVCTEVKCIGLALYLARTISDSHNIWLA